MVGATLVGIAILVMAFEVQGMLSTVVAVRMNNNRLAKADLEEINSHVAGSKRAVEFAYKTPFAQFGEGFVILYASVPRLTYEYFKTRPQVVSSLVADQVTRDVGAYVIDKHYFPTVESVRAAPNLALLDPKPSKFNDGDKLIELRTVFLLIRG